MKNEILPIALATAAIMAAVEVPLSRRFPLVTPIPTATRVAVAAGMGFVAALVAGYAIRSISK